MEALKKREEQLSIGIILVACLNFFFGFAAFALALLALPSFGVLAIILFVKASSLFISGLGLLKLKLWAWFFAVAITLIGLFEFALYPNAIPLEIVVLPYLLIKRKNFWKMKNHDIEKGF